MAKAHHSTPSATHLYGLHDPNGEGFTFHKSQEDRDAYAREVIEEYLIEGEWSDEVTGIFAFAVTHRATATDVVEKKGELDEDGYDENGEYWPDNDADCKCNYALKPIKEPQP